MLFSVVLQKGTNVSEETPASVISSEHGDSRFDGDIGAYPPSCRASHQIIA